MAHNKLYRNFIILQEDERGYSSSKDKALSGYAKVEAKGDKCKVSFYAQNLKPDGKYSMVLICCKKDSKQLIDLGPLAINEVGKGDTSKEYYINNIAGLGISYEKISGAAISRNNGNESIFIMYGFMNGEDSTENWRKFKLVKINSSKNDNKSDLLAKDANKTLIKESKEIGKIKKEDERKFIENSAITAKDVKNEDIVSEAENKAINEVEFNENKDKGQDMENIKTEILDENNSKVNVKDEIDKLEDVNRIDDSIEYIDEDRHKKKKLDKSKKDCDDKKCHYEKEDHIKKEDYCEKKEHEHESCNEKKSKENDDVLKHEHKCKENEEKQKEKKEDIEECIKKCFDKLESYEGNLEIELKNAEGDFLIYGIIIDKSKNIYNCKKFKLEKHCTSGYEIFYKRQDNSKRILENTKEDDFEFEQYEKEIDNISDSNNIVIKGKAGEYFENLAKDFEPYTQKLDDINYCKWYKVDVNSIDDLCDESNYNKYTLAYYPMLNYYPYINKNNYFLLGYKCDEDGELKYIVYGIPGSKEKSDQPYGGKTGFVTWTNDNTRNQGYWLMFYDYKNSTIVVPMK